MAMFALGDYRGAAREAHAALILGHNPEAKKLLDEIVAKVPQDKVAAELVKQIEEASRSTAPQTAAKSTTTKS